MNKQKRFFIKIGMAISIATILTCSTSFASSNVLEKVEYTEKFKNWLQLTEEEKQKTIMPDMYYIPSSSKKISNNPLQDVRSTRASMASRFSLKDIISENVKIHVGPLLRYLHWKQIWLCKITRKEISRKFTTFQRDI